jgi:hypothetical protein
MGLFGILTEKERNLVNKATTQERERIIKLLESKRCECLNLDKEQFVELAKKEGVLKHANCDWVGLDWAIELIKGETK